MESTKALNYLDSQSHYVSLEKMPFHFELEKFPFGSIFCLETFIPAQIDFGFP
jgi:hypothetical protein